MVGTRLAIQATFFVEFVLLICIAAYFGLCHFNNDVLCTPLFRQAGRSLLVLPHDWNEQNLFYLETKESKPLRRYKLHVTLVLEDGFWARGMDSILSENNLGDHPCLVGPIQTEISVNGNLSNKAREVISADDNKTEYQVSGATVAKSWLSSRRDPQDKSRLDVLIYVPIKSRMPLYIKLDQQEQVSALSWEQALITLVEHSDDNKTASVENAMEYVEPFLQDKCQLSSDSTMWWKRLVHDTCNRAKGLVAVNHNVMSKFSFKVPITNNVARRWQTSVALVNEGILYAKKGNYMAAVECFEESLVISQSLLRDSTLMEPIDMQTDHYMAVFFPLIFPLLLPFIAGLGREVKRYRKLKQGKGGEIGGIDSKTKVD